ncbi:hypothetical protein ACH5RR_037361 [Cinchona calisaya]|uniref:SWIM-type domain-containing protein n=1 Tax=Cinchona calisaya TaxID=153742 RepID=A0ABD2Y915_9GENT
MDANCSSTDDAPITIACICNREVSDVTNNAESHYLCYFARDFKGDPVLESALEVYGNLSCDDSSCPCTIIANAIHYCCYHLRLAMSPRTNDRIVVALRNGRVFPSDLA